MFNKNEDSKKVIEFDLDIMETMANQIKSTVNKNGGIDDTDIDYIEFLANGLNTMMAMVRDTVKTIR